jgi:hypothetical protein
MNPDELKKALHDMDLLVRPNIVFCNPKQYDMIKDALENQPFIVEADVAVEEGKTIVVDRKKMEEWARPKVRFDFDD